METLLQALGCGDTRDWPPATSPKLDDLGTTIDHLIDITPLP
jgi:hypothetical protein